MQLNTVRLIHGPSLFSPSPSVLVTLSGSDETPAGEAAYHQAAKDWPQIAPTLKAITGKQRDGRQGAAQLIAELVNHLLQSAGVPTGEIAIRHDAPQGKTFIAVPQQNVRLTGQICAQSSTYVLRLFSNGMAPRALADLRELASHADALCKRAAIADMQRQLVGGNIPWLALDHDGNDKDLLQLGFGTRQRRIDGTTVMESSHIGIDISCSKRRTQALLNETGFPVPEQRVVSTVSEAIQNARQMRYPVVLKAEIGTKGERVFADLRNDNELAQAFEQLQTLLRPFRMPVDILLEKHVHGRVYRIEIVAGRFFDAYEMIPAAVFGDGVHTIRELVARENANPNRQDQGHLKAKYCKLKIETAERLMLQKQGLTADAIPAKGHCVRLSANSNWSAGGTFRRISEHAHEDNIRIAERAAALMKIHIAGIDLISEDIGRSFLETPLTLIEVNHSPYIASFTDDETGETLDNGPRLLERLAEGLEYGQVPIITVTASEQSSRIIDALAAFLTEQGRQPGHVRNGHMEINGVAAGVYNQTVAADPALAMLQRPDIGSVLVEKSLPQLADLGLGAGGCDIAVITDCDIRELTTQAWSRGISSDEIIRLLAGQARRGVVLCVDDMDVAQHLKGLGATHCVIVTTDQKLADSLNLTDMTVLSPDSLEDEEDGTSAAAVSALVVKAVTEMLQAP